MGPPPFGLTLIGLPPIGLGLRPIAGLGQYFSIFTSTLGLGYTTQSHIVQLGFVQLGLVQMGLVQLGLVQGLLQMGVDPSGRIGSPFYISYFRQDWLGGG